MVINVYLSSLIICDIQAELNFCDIEMGDVEKIKGCKGSCQVKFFMIIVLALTQQLYWGNFIYQTIYIYMFNLTLVILSLLVL